MFKECPVTNECSGLCLAIKGTSITVCGKKKKKTSEGKKKKNTPPFKSCRASHFVCRPSSCLWNSQCLSKHHETWDQWGASNDLSLLQGSSLSQRAMPEYPHRTNLICDWTGHHLCEQHHLSVKRSHAACEIWWEETKRRKRKKEGQNTFSMVKKQKEDMESHPSSFLSLLLCFILL